MKKPTNTSEWTAADWAEQDEAVAMAVFEARQAWAAAVEQSK